jgi:hypothetical protein
MIKPHELHETNLADAVMNYLLHFFVARCGSHVCNKFDMFGLPIASSTDATTTSKGFGDVMLHRCMLTWRVCMFVFLRRGPKRLEDRRSPQSLM